ncbi:unnamed protein product, partial [Mesorhabditis spiculigera]
MLKKLLFALLFFAVTVSSMVWEPPENLYASFPSGAHKRETRMRELRIPPPYDTLPLVQRWIFKRGGARNF